MTLGLLTSRKYFTSVLLLLTIFIPINYISNNSAYTVFYPGLVFSSGFLCKEISIRRKLFFGNVLKNPILIFTIFFLILGALSTPLPKRSLSFDLSLILILLILSLHGEVIHTDALIKVWATSVAVLGIMVVYEILNKNSFIYSKLNIKSMLPINQNWTTYRIVASFGHPLTAGTFFACTAIIFLHLYFIRKNYLNLFITLLSTICTFLTFSRGSIIGLVFGIFLSLLRNQFKRSFATKVISLLAIGIPLLFIAIQIIGFRSKSLEGYNSFSTRVDIFKFYIVSPSRIIFGVGGGNAQVVFNNSSSNRLILENSILQALLGLGLLNLMLYLYSIRFILNKRKFNTSLSPFLVTFLISISSFNYFEGARWLHMILPLSILVLTNTDLAFDQNVTNNYKKD